MKKANVSNLMLKIIEITRFNSKHVKRVEFSTNQLHGDLR